MRTKTASALTLLVLGAVIVLYQEGHLFGRELSSHSTEPNNQEEPRANAGTSTDGKPANPWALSPFGKGSAAVAIGPTSGSAWRTAFRDPELTDAGRKLLCSYTNPNNAPNTAQGEPATPQPTTDPYCAGVDAAQVQQAISTLQNRAKSNDIDATLLLANHWLVEQRIFAKSQAEVKKIKAPEINQEAKNSDGLAVSASPDPLKEVEKPKEAAIERELVEVERQLLTLSASGRPDVFRQLATLYASKESSVENTEQMLALQLASDMRHPDVMATTPSADSLSEFPIHLRAGIQRKTEEIMVKCCAR